MDHSLNPLKRRRESVSQDVKPSRIYGTATIDGGASVHQGDRHASYHIDNALFISREDHPLLSDQSRNEDTVLWPNVGSENRQNARLAVPAGIPSQSSSRHASQFGNVSRVHDGSIEDNVRAYDIKRQILLKLIAIVKGCGDIFTRLEHSLRSSIPLRGIETVEISTDIADLDEQLNQLNLLLSCEHEKLDVWHTIILEYPYHRGTVNKCRNITYTLKNLYKEISEAGKSQDTWDVLSTVHEKYVVKTSILTLTGHNTTRLPEEKAYSMSDIYLYQFKTMQNRAYDILLALLHDFVKNERLGCENYKGVLSGDTASYEDQARIKALRVVLRPALGNDDATIDRNDSMLAAGRIVKTLEYRGIRERRDRIAVAHDATFAWAVSTQEYSICDNLLKWLCHGQGCFWINGKAASGKSTFLKYLARNPTVHQACRFWAGDDECDPSASSSLPKHLQSLPLLDEDWAGSENLIFGAFYFWHLGSTIQKSQQGLLRSLLHAILKRCGHLAKAIMPLIYYEVLLVLQRTKHQTAIQLSRSDSMSNKLELLANAKLKQPTKTVDTANLLKAHRTEEAEVTEPSQSPESSDSHEPTELTELISLMDLTDTEVKHIFWRAIDQLSHNKKIVFFIDGIDEYDGDQREMCRFLKSLAGTSFKLVLSSRPIHACTIEFENLPSLRLQDLTHNDIKKYINDELYEQESMKSLIMVDGQAADGLVNDILNKASGVFLWVILVVRKLVSALETGDTIEELVSLVNRLPDELTDLYQHMMNNIEPAHAKHGAWYLRLLQQSYQVQVAGTQLTLLQLLYAEEANNCQMTCWNSKARFNAFNMDKMDAEAWRLRARLRTRCCGLIEAPENMAPTKAENVVLFLHKTVADFLEIPSVQQSINALSKDKTYPYGPSLSLAASCVLAIQTISSISAIHGAAIRDYLSAGREYLIRARRLGCPEKYLSMVSLALDEEGDSRRPANDYTEAFQHPGRTHMTPRQNSKKANWN